VLGGGVARCDLSGRDAGEARTNLKEAIELILETNRELSLEGRGRVRGVVREKIFVGE